VLQFLRRRWLAAVVVLVVSAGLVVATIYLRRGSLLTAPRQVDVEPKSEAPADLDKLREVFNAGVDALQRSDGRDAVRHFTSFDFGERAVEEYRLYYLANGYQLAGNAGAARLTLARLWTRTPRLIYANDVAFNLGGLYADRGDWKRSSEVYASLARRAEVPAVAAAARWNATLHRLHVGDVSGALYSARNILIHNPRSEQARSAAALVRALTGVAANNFPRLTPSEQLERAKALMASSDPQTALEELDVLARTAPGSLRSEVQLQRGIALHLLKRYEDSNKALEPLTAGPYKYAIPALRHAAKNYSILAGAIDPTVEKTIKERKRVGTIKQRVGKGKKRRTVTKPRYQTVFRKVKLVDLEKKKKKEEYERLTSERLKDLLLLPIDEATKVVTLNALIERAQSKNQDAYVQELVGQVVKLDPQADPALQYFWDKSWGAYTRGDLATARRLFRFIGDTYTHTNVRRQADYWYARSAERQGDKEEASAIYQKLASAPYEDLYAQHAVKRGAKREENRTNPLKLKKDDWRELAAKEMPEELELAYELLALSSVREAYLELRRNMQPSNVRFAEALMAEVHQHDGNEVLMYRSLRKAWPQLATVDQDSVPAHFLEMYYPRKYAEPIEQYSKERGLDPNLVRGLILQESYYNPEAKSRVGATGLMQLMPATASDHARRLRIPFATSRLENPDVNVHLGTFHLKMLVNMFKGNTYLAVASYNAGQGNVMKWQRAAPGKPLDEFLESIPFPETRNYVKRVTMLRSAYSRLTL
jgi:soluble lytic murein transglycosylase-like protein